MIIYVFFYIFNKYGLKYKWPIKTDISGLVS